MRLSQFPFDESGVRELLESPDTLAFTLMTIILNKYDTDCFEWESAVLFKAIEEDFHVKLPEECEERINAAIMVLTSDLPFISFNVFTAVALAFAEGNIGTIADGQDEELNTCEILWALYEISLLLGITVPEVQEKFTDKVIDAINNTIDGESEDKEDLVDDDTDTVAEAANEPYYSKYVTVTLLELCKQLAKMHVHINIIVELFESCQRSKELLAQETGLISPTESEKKDQ